MMDAIYYVLRTGIHWKALPRVIGAGSSVHDRFQEWRRQGVFKTLWQAGLLAYDAHRGIQWQWQASNSRSKRRKGWCLAIVSSAFYTTKGSPQRASAN